MFNSMVVTRSVYLLHNKLKIYSNFEKDHSTIPDDNLTNNLFIHLQLYQNQLIISHTR